MSCVLCNIDQFQHRYYSIELCNISILHRIIVMVEICHTYRVFECIRREILRTNSPRNNGLAAVQFFFCRICPSHQNKPIGPDPVFLRSFEVCSQHLSSQLRAMPMLRLLLPHLLLPPPRPRTPLASAIGQARGSRT